MRVYLAVTPKQIRTLLDTQMTFEEYLAPEQFEFDADVDQESREHLISVLAAEESLELNQGKVGLVLAVDLADHQLNGEPISVDFKQVAALFYSLDGEELSWYAPEEIEYQLPQLIEPATNHLSSESK